jgi:hypothetical protein
MHLDFWMIGLHVLICEAAHYLEKKLVQFVQGLVMCWVAVYSVAVFIAKYQEQKSRGNSPALSYPSL